MPEEAVYLLWTTDFFDQSATSARGTLRGIFQHRARAVQKAGEYLASHLTDRVELETVPVDLEPERVSTAPALDEQEIFALHNALEAVLNLLRGHQVGRPVSVNDVHYHVAILEPWIDRLTVSKPPVEEQLPLPPEYDPEDFDQFKEDGQYMGTMPTRTEAEHAGAKEMAKEMSLSHWCNEGALIAATGQQSVTDALAWIKEQRQSETKKKWNPPING